MTLPPPPHHLPTPHTQYIEPNDQAASIGSPGVAVGASDDRKKQFRFAHHAYRDRALIQHAIILRIYDIEHGTAEVHYQQLTNAVWTDLTMDHAEYIKPSEKAVRKRYGDQNKLLPDHPLVYM